MDEDQYRKKIEKEIIEIVEQRLTNRLTDATRTREIARYIIATLHPHMTIEQIYNVAKNFDHHFPELSPIVLLVSKDKDQLIKETVVNQIEKLLKANLVDKADAMMKKSV